MRHRVSHKSNQHSNMTNSISCSYTNTVGVHTNNFILLVAELHCFKSRRGCHSSMSLCVIIHSLAADVAYFMFTKARRIYTRGSSTILTLLFTPNHSNKPHTHRITCQRLVFDHREHATTTRICCPVGSPEVRGQNDTNMKDIIVNTRK